MVSETEQGLRINLTRSEDLSYDIIIENGLLHRVAEDLKQRNLGREVSKFALITDTTVSAKYGVYLEESLRSLGMYTERFAFSPGEKSKKLGICEDLINDMSSHGFGRDSAVIALGGGVVGDMAGFVASIFNRGVPCVQIPTTLLAQADSSVGGKTGVDTEHGKNLIGRIEQPKVVYIDPLVLRTLPPMEYFNGLAETVKHGVIQDSEFFEYLEQNANRILSMDSSALLRLARTNCRIKGNVVEKDPEEKGLRRILNLGHTIGHAIEKLSYYQMYHGQCVSIGTLAALRIAEQVTGFPAGDFGRVSALLQYFNLPTTIPGEIKDDNIIRLTTLDKKAAKGQARYSLPTRIGEMAEFDGKYATPVDEKIVREALQTMRE